jgi:hypothetical protein
MKNEREFSNRKSWLLGALAGLSALAFSACAHSDQRPPVAGSAPHGFGQTLVGENAGVRVLARLHAWNGDPPTLSQYVLPVWIQIENHSGRALWLRYDSLRVEDATDSHVTLSALPPFTVKGKAIIPVSAVPPEFGLEDTWMGTWLEPGFDDYLASTMHWQESLPTREMLRRAIRDGVVIDGGKIAGFVYFPRTSQDPAALTLSAGLVDAMTKQSFGRIEIPLAGVLH